MKYAFIGGVAIGAIVAVILLARSGKEKSVEMGPGETVEAFYRAMSRGDFDGAMSLCDTAAMASYVDAYRKAFEEASHKDSSATAIAASILSEAKLEVSDVRKEEDRRIVFYSVCPEGMEGKEKVATLRKEEGAWIVTDMRDRN